MILSGGRAIDFAPQALGEIVPALSNGFFYGRDTLELAGKFATYGAMYRVQPAIATVIDKAANAQARLTINVWNGTGAGKTLDTTSPYARLIANPCPILSPYNFWRWTATTYEIYGEAFWYKFRDAAGNVVALLPMHPSRVMVERDDDGRVTYIFTIGIASTGILRAGEDDVVPFMRYNPDDLMRGLSRLEPLRTTLLNEDAARRANASFWRRGARPSMVLSTEKKLQDRDAERLQDRIEAKHASPDRVGSVLALGDGMTPTVVNLNLEEMQYIESRKLNREEVCMVYDIPPPAVHILDHATFSNITEQNRMLYRDAMAPRLEDIESVVDTYLRPEFDPSASRRAKFALDDVLRGDFETRATAAQQLVNAGIYKPAEARALFDLPDAGPVADALYANAALVPLGSTPRSPAEPAQDGSEPGSGQSEPPPLARAASVRAIMGRLGRVKANRAELRRALVAEHESQLAAFFQRQSAAAQVAVQRKDAGVLDTDDWNDDLSGILLSLAQATSKTVGDAVAKKLRANYDPDVIIDWLQTNAGKSAAHINTTTAEQLAAALQAASEPDPETGETTPALTATRGYFDGIGARITAIALGRVAMVSGLATQVAAQRGGAKSKTWRVTSGNARPSHAAMDGETVGIDDTFSNGMNAPGDPAGGADEVAGCTCDLEISTGE